MNLKTFNFNFKPKFIIRLIFIGGGVVNGYLLPFYIETRTH